MRRCPLVELDSDFSGLMFIIESNFDIFLQSRNGGDRSNDAELDSYLENRHSNLIGNDRALRTITNNIFSVIINIEQAAHIPTVYSKQE